MFEAVGRDNWEKYMYILQCTNADISIMTTVFNHGYSIHEFSRFRAPHHVRTIDAQFGAFKGTGQSAEVYALACNFFEVQNLTSSAKSHCPPS